MSGFRGIDEGGTNVELPHVQVCELQHWKSVPRHVALLFVGPHSPLVLLSGSMTVLCVSVHFSMEPEFYTKVAYIQKRSMVYLA